MPDTSDASYARRFLWLLMGVFAFRLIYLFTAVDFQIGGEEPYQWDWGRRLDWCYYSKPPLIAWLMALLRVTFGYHWWAVRLAALTLGTCSLALVFALGRRMFDARVGFFAALMLLCTPANVAANFLFNVDSPLVLCWTAALLLFWRAVEKPDNALNWVLLTLVIGIGTWAKLMMLVFLALMLVFALVSKPHRGLLKHPAFWFCVVGALLFLTPIIWWNHEHGWVTAVHEKTHVQGESMGFVARIGQFLQFPLLQAAVYSPLTFALLIAAMLWCWRNWRTANVQMRYLFLFSAPALILFQGLAARQYVNENWPAVFYLSAFVLGASVALNNERIGVWMQRGWKFGAVLIAGLYVFVPLIPVLGWTGSKKLDPAVSMRGWHEAAAIIGEMLANVPDPERTFVLVLDHRNYASQMAFHLPQHPTVYRWTREAKIESQYEVWPNAADKIGWDCLIIDPDSEDDGYAKNKLPSAVIRAFEKNHKLGDADIMLGNGTQRSFQVYIGKNMIHWPEQEPPVPTS